MRTFGLLVAATTAALLLACSSGATDSSQDPGDNADQGDEQDITSVKSQIAGAWLAESQVLGQPYAYEFAVDGSFSRDTHRILNGIMVKDAGPPANELHEVGRYTVNTSKHTITLHFGAPTTGTEVVAFAYQPGRILNGLFLPDAAPPKTQDTLTLTEQPAPGSNIAFPSVTYERSGGKLGDACAWDGSDPRKGCGAGLYCASDAPAVGTSCHELIKAGEWCPRGMTGASKTCADGLKCVADPASGDPDSGICQ